MKKRILFLLIVLLLVSAGCVFNQVLFEPKFDNGIQRDGSIIAVVEISPRANNFDQIKAYGEVKNKALDLLINEIDPNKELSLRPADLENVVDVKITTDRNFYYAKISSSDVERMKNFYN